MFVNESAMQGKVNTPSSQQNRSGNRSYPSRTIIHPKLELTEPGDSDEQEADAAASDVMSGKVCRKISGGGAGGGMAVSSQMESQLNHLQGGGQTMPSGLRGMMERGFDRDFSQVRLHTDSEAAGLSSSINAKAFTHGNDIYFNRGQFSPETSEGQRLVAHELAHVAQGGGKVGRNIDDDIKNMRLYLLANFKSSGDVNKEFETNPDDYDVTTVKEFEGKEIDESLCVDGIECEDVMYWFADCDVYALEAVRSMEKVEIDDEDDSSVIKEKLKIAAKIKNWDRKSTFIGREYDYSLVNFPEHAALIVHEKGNGKNYLVDNDEVVFLKSGKLDESDLVSIMQKIVEIHSSDVRTTHQQTNLPSGEVSVQYYDLYVKRQLKGINIEREQTLIGKGSKL